MARSGSREPTKGASQQAQARLKEAVGALTGNRRHVKQGRADQARGRLREAVVPAVKKCRYAVGSGGGGQINAMMRAVFGRSRSSTAAKSCFMATERSTGSDRGRRRG